jgi:hypothetical protein
MPLVVYIIAKLREKTKTKQLTKQVFFVYELPLNETHKFGKKAAEKFFNKTMKDFLSLLRK